MVTKGLIASIAVGVLCYHPALGQPTVHNGQVGLWVHDPGKQRLLQLAFGIGAEPVSDACFRLWYPVDVEVDGRGDVYVLDAARRRIQVFDGDGNFRNSIALGKSEAIPSDIALHPRGSILVADGTSRIHVVASTGELQRSFPMPWRVQRVTVSTKGDLIALTPDQPFLLHRFSLEGQQSVAFCPGEAPRAAELRWFLGQAHLALDDSDSVYLSFEYPYRVVKFDPQGRAQLAFDRDLGQPIPGPVMVWAESGELLHSSPRRISLDLNIGRDGWVYNLVRSGRAQGADRIDVFTRQGEYLQSFYLGHPMTAMAFGDGDTVYFLRAYPDPQLEKCWIRPVWPRGSGDQER